ncbi:MAG: 1,6-anhydro-N-acetylmuramyl-L-alanine amidase AmpD [Gammaproteobacteria bacterium]|nr:1,6-anhydro-N-acetylmuramyl-L-alanine amidase AmpD [Gammaproteobacteria bacterium]MBU1555319.1 1,6-anhydro-N-acetylmuramyl-L-alanine amidase AmpD [Gammaproteobacteria bacterium]MBU2072476.1 1,6-anhydro-N-acetylmuramyl-L-alanine amidase AmpD [Gammaproteobacteria bacterium]MBU2181401.1 1,6-anhydro-N-acetylmuramyl-L-alanine amidase AmpD [Gammaproteobacteria bacterium]MBU2204273.1 1,6-anhydro-N-acetylmuramyl-L-alanine amidase AmpD [Gammaproteobacteria bacterium]
MSAPVILQRPSPHCDARPAGESISLLVIHNISLPAGQFASVPEHSFVDALFRGCLDCSAKPDFASLRDVRVSAHCVIWRDGRIFQYVPFAKRAWHAGVSQFAGRERCNDFSIGIELEGTDNLPYTEAQYQSLIQLTELICRQFPAITPQRITGHSDIAPGRKTDPGIAFDWMRYRSAIIEWNNKRDQGAL